MSDYYYNETIFVDESGNPGLSAEAHNTKFPFFVMGFTFCNDPNPLKTELHNLLAQLKSDGKYHALLSELKFYPKGALKKIGCSDDEIESDWKPHFNYVREKTNQIILKYADGVFGGILDKRSVIEKTWTSVTIGNFLFNRSLFENILPNIEYANTPDVIYDRGRLNPTRTRAFNQYMYDAESYLKYAGLSTYDGRIGSFKDVDSTKNSGIWASDFVAGSFRHALQHKDKVFVNLLKPKFIGTGYRYLWKY